MTGRIFNIQRFSVNDGPGIRTTVFLKDCPLSCVWCHNPESQSQDRKVIYKANRCLHCGACAEFCPQHAIHMNDTVYTDPDLCNQCGTCLEYCYAEAREIAGQEISVDELLVEIEKDRPFYQESGGGLTLSGGEPLMQPEFVHAVLEECQLRGFHTALDTCGYAEWSTLDTIRPFVDLFLFDLKIMDDLKHVKYTGVSHDIILKNLRRLAELGEHIKIRIPIIPGITNDDNNITALCEFVKKLPGDQSIDLLPYHNIAKDKYQRLQKTYDLENLTTPSDDEMLKIKQCIEQFDIEVNIGG